MIFSPGGERESAAVGMLEVQGQEVTGTVLTPYGDYRYLAGIATDDSLFLSNFDGMHVMLFTAALGDTIHGMYYSGNHHAEPFVAWRNEEAALPDAFSLASAPSDQPFTVLLQGEGGEPVNWLAHGKPSIIEIMGTWCPNCKDEARLLDTIHRAYVAQGLQVIGLSFERARDSLQAVRNLQRMQDYMQLSYPVVYAGYANSEGVAKVLPLLQGFTAYPTTIFVHGDGTVEAVHTGFSGPATGRAYTQTAEQYYSLVGRLLQQQSGGQNGHYQEWSR
jgi:thiol-disulfide isomerase/thioredoxin